MDPGADRAADTRTRAFIAAASGGVSGGVAGGVGASLGLEPLGYVAVAVLTGALAAVLLSYLLRQR